MSVQTPPTKSISQPGLAAMEALEEPGPDENPIIVSIEPQPREQVGFYLALASERKPQQAIERRSLR